MSFKKVTGLYHSSVQFGDPHVTMTYLLCMVIYGVLAATATRVSKHKWFSSQIIRTERLKCNFRKQVLISLIVPQIINTLDKAFVVEFATKVH